MKEYLKKFKCLGDETRIRIIKVLIEANSELCVCEIVDSLKIPVYSISKHLKELKNANILKETRDGKFIFYTFIEKDFNSKIIDLVKTIPDDYFKMDKESLQKRLLLRNNGKCVIGMND